MTQLFDFNLTDTDIELCTEYMMKAADHNEQHINSDDFRNWGLADGFTDPAHEIGAFFAKLKANGVLVPVGEEPSEISSNNKRKVDLFKFDYKRWSSILRSRLP